MKEFMFTSEGSIWAYKPVIETDPEKIAEAEQKFQALLDKLEEKVYA
ncbi:hypothetical protein EauM23_00052 [Exiguobacterium phage vB_EauM-23]|nr:hypothetical protein EauM23_00052 [Exiguobacterium phage vB_EauM-23]